MKCPSCGTDCVSPAEDLIATIPTVFLPCPHCSMRVLDKRAPPPALGFSQPCSCGKRFIDDVFAHMFVIMAEEGDLHPADPLITVGTPLVHPGYNMDRPPFLPEKSLLLLSPIATKRTAVRLMEEVPELRGVIKKEQFIPGIAGTDLKTIPRVYELLAGCDVRADVFLLRTGPLVMFKQQSKIHIEFPRLGYEKIRSVEQHVGTHPTGFFVDACSGVGTLGLTAACMGVPHVILNDAWYASAFWSAVNLEVNRESLAIDTIRILKQPGDMADYPVAGDPIKIAETVGRQVIDIYQGDFHHLPRLFPPGSSPVSALDLFEKKDSILIRKIKKEWLDRAGGEVFIP